MIFRLRDFVFYPRAIHRFHDFLGTSEAWPAERLRGWVQERLERSLLHASSQVPYYRRTLEPFRARFAGMIERLDLSELPFLTKEDVRTHFEELKADDWQRYGAAPTHTSGSSGTPTKFLLDRESNISHFAAIWRVLNWAGYRFGQRFADLTGYVPSRGRLYQYDPRLNCLHLSSFNFKRENIGRYAERLRRFRPVVFKAYPSSLDLFCRWVEDAGIAPPLPGAVLTCAESLLEHQRATIERVLPVPLFDFYNQNERAALISTCAEGRYHCHEEYGLVELVDAGGGGQGSAEVVATTFHNRAMPLIRYRTGDLATEGPRMPCPCGRPYRTVASIQGRIEDIVVTPDGRHVGRLDAAFKHSPGIRLSRIVQRTTEEIQVDIVKAESYSARDQDTLERELRVRLGGAIGIRYNFVDTIPPGPNGKIKFVVSDPGRAALRGRGNLASAERISL
jgi:phenylacetate-CoA ligase